jgi:hypothetical protein
MNRRFIVPGFVLFLSMLMGLAAAPSKLTGGNGTLYLGGYSKRLFVLSQDRTRFYVLDASMERFETIDLATRQTLDTFTLSEANKKVRVRSFEVDPLHRFIIMLARTSTKLPDRFENSPPTLLQYDLKAHKVTRTIPWPKGDEREFVQILISPDGKLLYFFSDDVLIYDTTEFKQIDKWEISKPIEDGFGRVEFSEVDLINEDPGFFTGIFTVEDPVQRRRLMGVGRVNLLQKSIDFYTLGPASPVSFTLAPDRKRAYGLLQQIGRYEFWTFDLEHRALASRTEFSGRPRMSVKTSSNGKLLYIYQAGNTIDVYEAATYKYLRTVTLDADMTTEMYVLPASAPVPTAQR